MVELWALLRFWSGENTPQASLSCPTNHYSVLRTPGGLSTLSLIRDNTVSLRGLLADTRGERGLFKLQMSPEASRKQSCEVISWVAWTFQQLIAANEMQWCSYVLMIFDV